MQRSSTLAEDTLQNYIPFYLRHGGNLFIDLLPGIPHYFTLRNLLLCCGPGTAELICESLFHSSSFLTVDEFSSFGICLLGTVAQVNSGFRTRLKAYLASYRSPLLAAGTIYADHLLESTFGMASVLRRFHGMNEWNSRVFLAALCRTGIPSMLRPFIDTGIDLNAHDDRYNMLGNAAAVANLDSVRMLIESGANGAPALHHFIRFGEKLSDGIYKHLLELLVENARPTSFRDVGSDALWAVMRSSRALLTHPEAPEILFRRQVFSFQLLNWPCRKDHMCSYMCVAIRKRLGSVVELLLQYGAYANTTSTWLLFSVEGGAASCTEALIQHGAYVNFVDGAGRSALQVARSNVIAPHPRIFPCCERVWELDYKVTAEEDAETLAVVERAFRLKAQSTNNLTVHEPSYELEPQSLNEKSEAVPAPQNIFGKAFRSLFTNYRRPILGWHSRRQSDYETGDLWSLSFREALLMRFFYLLSYVLLLALGIIAFIRGDKQARMLSRSIMSAVALLSLAFIWGTSS